MTTTLTIQPTQELPYTNQYIGDNEYTDDGNDIFDQYSGDVFTLPVTTDSEYFTTTINVLLGYQSGTANLQGSAFTVSLLGQNV